LAKYYEDFEVGERYTSRPRVVTATDIDLFATVTGAVNPLFLSDEFAKSLGFTSRIAPGLLTLSLTVGLSYQTGLLDNMIALLALNSVRFTGPVAPGDTLTVQIEVASKRETTKPDRGLVTFKSVSTNQRGEKVLEIEQLVLCRRRPT